MHFLVFEVERPSLALLAGGPSGCSTLWAFTSKTTATSKLTSCDEKVEK